MSYLPPEQTGYFEALQVYFTEVTRRVALFGARDRELLEQWKQEGRPARLVCRGIRDAAMRSEEEGEPRSLARCKAFVDRRWEEAQRRSVGEHEAKPAQKSAPVPERTQVDPLRQRVEGLIREAGEGAPEERWTQAYRQGWRAIREQCRGEEEEFTLADVEAVDEALLDAYLDALKARERQDLQESLAVQKGALHRMSEEARRDHLRARQKKELVRRFNLLDLLADLFR